MAVVGGAVARRMAVSAQVVGAILVAIALAGLVYTRLYATILDGFDRKLVTTSTSAVRPSGGVPTLSPRPSIAIVLPRKLT